MRNVSASRKHVQKKNPAPSNMASHNIPRAATYEPRAQEQRQNELKAISKYQSLINRIESQVTCDKYTFELLELTTEVLVENPEYYTIWNVRKRCLIYGLFSKLSDSSLRSNPSHNTSQIDTIITSADGYLSSTSTSLEGSTRIQADPSLQTLGKNGTTLELIQKDLNFLVPLMRKWPKCYWLWNHRMWLLHEATRRLDASFARRLWEDEMGLVSMMLIKDNRNFHGWNYRRTVVVELESHVLKGTSMVESEFAYTTKMIKANLSNFSAWHNRSKLMPRLLDERNANDAARRKFVDNEFEMMRNALWVDSSDQSLWFYYQFLLTTITNPAAHSIILPDFTQADRVEFMEGQISFLKDLLDGAEDTKWIYNALIDCTTALWNIKGSVMPYDVKPDLMVWLDKLQKLDPIRRGRWEELRSMLGLGV